MRQKAVFISRDHMLMAVNGAICTPEQVRVAPGATDAVRMLHERGYLVVAIANEPGVARGLFDEEALELVHGRLKQILAKEGAALDGIYYCPYLDSAEAVVPQYRRHSELRIPHPGMLHQAAGDSSIDLSASWLVGRTEDDIAAGQAAGCRTILLADADGSGTAEGTLHGADYVFATLRDPRRSRRETPHRLQLHGADYVFATLREAAELILSSPPVRQPAPASDGSHPAVETGPAAYDEAAPPAGAVSTEDVVDRLDAMLDLLRQQRRATMHSDFSTVKLLGAVCQMIALGLLLWSWVAMMDGRTDAAISRGLSTIAVQLIALTLFVLHRRE